MIITEAAAIASPETIAKSNRRRTVKWTLVNGNWHMEVMENEFIYDKLVIELSDDQTIKWILIKGVWHKDEDEQPANID